jgi:hypothetical protein
LGNNATNDGSSSPSDASSTQMEDHARFVASQTCCANMLMLHQNGLPSDTELRQRATDMLYNSNAVPPRFTLRGIL